MGAIQPGGKPEYVYRPSPARVRMPFRVLGALVGAPFFAVPAYAVWQLVSSILHRQWSDVPTLVGLAGAFSLMIPMGLKMIRAARTGLDPFSEARVMEAEASRAMLEAVKRTGTQPGSSGR